MTKHDRYIEARAEVIAQLDMLAARLAPEPATIYGELAFVRRLRAMARAAGKMADRIAARSPDAIFTLAGRAGYVASRYRSDWVGRAQDGRDRACLNESRMSLPGPTT